MADFIYDSIVSCASKLEEHIQLVALEDYALGMGQNVSYQIAEVAAVLKYRLMLNHIPLALINPRKRMSYVARKRTVSKAEVVAWAEAQGFELPKKKPGGPGYYAREREDLADAYVMAIMGRQLDLYLQEGCPPLRGDIFLDPDTGLAFRDDLLFNNEYTERVHVTQ